MKKTMENIRNLISKFANSFDKKDWTGLRSTLSDEVECDYSALRGNIETITGDDYVAKRINALDKLSTHHIISNYEIQSDDKNATCIASTMIWRKQGNSEFNTHALYTFKLTNADFGWKICAIKQEVYWNEGDASIHSGVKK